MTFIADRVSGQELKAACRARDRSLLECHAAMPRLSALYHAGQVPATRYTFTLTRYIAFISATPSFRWRCRAGDFAPAAGPRRAMTSCQRRARALREKCKGRGRRAKPLFPRRRATGHSMRERYAVKPPAMAIAVMPTSAVARAACSDI